MTDIKRDELTPEELEVLKLIREDGIEADLNRTQKDIRDDLEERDYIYYLGDEYDVNIYLRDKGKDALDQTDPAWWASEYKSRRALMRNEKARLDRMPEDHERAVRSLEQRREAEVRRYDEWIEKEKRHGNERLREHTERVAELQAEFAAWVKENRARLHGLNLDEGEED